MKKCPDCGAELTEVVVERMQTQTFLVDDEKQEITALQGELGWEYSDHAYHCPQCDSLNVDSMFTDYKWKSDK